MHNLPNPRVWVFKTNHCTVEKVVSRTLTEAKVRVNQRHKLAFPRYYYDFYGTYPLNRLLG